MNWEEFFKSCGEEIYAKPIPIFDSYALAIEAARLGQGVLLDWSLCMDRHLARGELKRVGRWKLAATGGLRVFYPKRRQISSCAKSVVDWLSTT